MGSVRILPPTSLVADWGLHCRQGPCRVTGTWPGLEGSSEKGAGRRRAQGWAAALTAILAVLHAVAVEASSSHALWGPPLEGDGGVRDILHRQVAGLTGGAWAEGRPERGLSESAPARAAGGPQSREILPLRLAFKHFEKYFSSIKRHVSRQAYKQTHTQAASVITEEIDHKRLL